MTWKKESIYLILMLGALFFAFYLPVGNHRFDNAVMESLYLVKWYAREHVLLCLVPAFFIAGAISVFVSQQSVMKYLGAKANKFLAYGVASISGTILAVCSCTVLPLFAGIWRMGAGLGPATAFLYSGPAINVLAIILTARILGMSLGVARAVGAVSFSIVIGLLMHLIFRKENTVQSPSQATIEMNENHAIRPLWKTILYFISMIGILVFANWAKPADASGVWFLLYRIKWILTGIFILGLAFICIKWFSGEELRNWYFATWTFAKQILPLLLIGVLISGFLLGRVGHEGIVPSKWISDAVGGNSFQANFFASFTGALMYFATLTEVPILQGLIGSGMGKGPALALLLAGPSLSLPSMIVINSIMGTKKTVVYVALVVIMATITGLIYGSF